MFHLLFLLSLIVSNHNGVFAVILGASMLSQLGYNNESSEILIRKYEISDIDPNAFKGYTKLTYFNLQSSSLSKIDLGLFKDSVNLQSLHLINNPSLTELTNSKKIVFPFMQILTIWETPLTNLDSNVINALPNLTEFECPNSNRLSPLKPNQLSSWKKVQTLFLRTKNQTSLTKEYFNGLSSLSYLSFLNSNIKTVEVHTLLSLPNLTNVEFYYNDITAFEYLQIPNKLDILDLQGNKMNYFMLSRTMGFIKNLRINNNLFRSFKSMDFTFLANLTLLDLSNNPHAYPNEIAGHMKPLVNLFQVGLNNLSISSIDSNFFKQNIKLRYIYLSNNKIKVISYDAFVNLKALNEIDLSYNEISILDNRTFSGFDHFWGIYFQFNKLTKIASRTFFNLGSLYKLDFSNNFISEIESSAFSGFSVAFIKLEYNRISKLWPRSFEDLKTFTLTLNYNQITEIDNSMFSGLTVENLYLSNNNISRIGPGTFNNASNIQYLYLSFNRLTKLDNGIFLGLSNVRSIDLNSNIISTIEVGSFNGLTNLQDINLNNNSLTQLDNSTFAGCNNLQSIYLTNNPIVQKSNLQNLCPIDAVNCKVYF